MILTILWLSSYYPITGKEKREKRKEKREKRKEELATDPHRQTQTDTDKDIHKKYKLLFALLWTMPKFSTVPAKPR